jgi:hypothetical protein
MGLEVKERAFVVKGRKEAGRDRKEGGEQNARRGGRM